jgi:manganese oxidase
MLSFFCLFYGGRMTGTTSPLVRVLCGVALIFGSACFSRGQQKLTPKPDGPPLGSNAVTPTVTAAMGDVGGRTFGRAPDPARTHRYFIAAEPGLWDFTPQGIDPVCGKPLPPPVVNHRRVGKTRYVRYTDETFTTKVFENPRLGILGPVLRGVVGDFVAVTFLNRGGQPLSMHPHGVKYDKDSEGSYYQPKPGLGAAVAPGGKFTYVWQLDEQSGPLPGEPSSKVWLYHSHVNGDEEANLGLVGFIVVTDPKRARPDATPSDIDREHAALFMMFDESGLGEAEREAAEYASLLPNNQFPVRTWSQSQELLEQGSRASINGYIFGNLPGLEMKEGERVRWYLFALGSERDFHTAHWHGARVVEDGRKRTDVVELLPASMKVADMVAENPGSWLFHCHVADHMTEGMFARMIVYPRESTRPLGPPFFGLVDATESVLIKRAEARLDRSGECEIRLEGVVTVFDAFSVFNQPFGIRVSERDVTFAPNRRGRGAVGQSEVVIKNASEFGVVYGGKMEFEVTLRGKEWGDALTKLGAKPNAPQPFVLPLKLKVGTATHDARANVQVAE